MKLKTILLLVLFCLFIFILFFLRFYGLELGLIIISKFVIDPINNTLNETRPINKSCVVDSDCKFEYTYCEPCTGQPGHTPTPSEPVNISYEPYCPLYYPVGCTLVGTFNLFPPICLNNTCATYQDGLKALFRNPSLFNKERIAHLKSGLMDYEGDINLHHPFKERIADSLDNPEGCIVLAETRRFNMDNFASSYTIPVNAELITWEYTFNNVLNSCMLHYTIKDCTIECKIRNYLCFASKDNFDSCFLNYTGSDGAYPYVVDTYTFNAFVDTIGDGKWARNPIEYGTDKWLSYTNQRIGYTLKYPAHIEVSEHQNIIALLHIQYCSGKECSLLSETTIEINDLKRDFLSGTAFKLKESKSIGSFTVETYIDETQSHQYNQYLFVIDGNRELSFISSEPFESQELQELIEAIISTLKFL